MWWWWWGRVAVWWWLCFNSIQWNINVSIFILELLGIFRILGIRTDWKSC
ncbi:hypothetical protein HanXRQr2_Chr02g0051471 [Helianthus annuus]|uniref:Uncharacterized protein n=1 Tax=Helianthus annuus TaxID=4232 RepID=A0A9K3JKS8_HELAN|nr:hypothetical protein HanXRQr2_Chr02g0051471 [Helianthus annuus]KAJ0950662.1 hypothetical protein HanPSC8_Chr02g0050921 [Helianthus annuus]